MSHPPPPPGWWQVYRLIGSLKWKEYLREIYRICLIVLPIIGGHWLWDYSQKLLWEFFLLHTCKVSHVCRGIKTSPIYIDGKYLLDTSENSHFRTKPLCGFATVYSREYIDWRGPLPCLHVSWLYFWPSLLRKGRGSMPTRFHSIYPRHSSHVAPSTASPARLARYSYLVPETETTFHHCWRVKISFKPNLNGIYLPMQLTDWLLVEVALLLIGLTRISLTKSGFDHPSEIESSLRLRGPILRSIAPLPFSLVIVPIWCDTL